MGPVDAVGATQHEGSVFSGQGLPMRAARVAKADLAERSWCSQDSQGLGREVTSSRGRHQVGQGLLGSDLCQTKGQELALQVS